MKLTRLLTGIAVLAAAAAMLAAPAAAQQPAAPTLTINQIDASKYPDLHVVATVLDSHGVPAKGLTTKDFQAFEGRTPLTIDTVQAAQDNNQKLATVIAIDVSGSMAGDPFDRARAAATRFVESMGPNDEAALIAFSDKVTPVVSFTSDAAKLKQGIASLQAVGGTALYEAVQTSAYVAASAKNARSAVIFLTDGENDTRTSNATAEGSSASAKGSGVPIFTIGFGATPDVAYLQGLATGTQGAYRAANAANVADVYADIATLLRNQYIVNVKGTGKPDGRDGSIQIIANVLNSPAAAVAAYKRGVAPVVAAAPDTQQQPAVTTTPKLPEKKSNRAAIVFAGIVAAVAAIIIGYLLFLWNRRRRTRLAQLEVVAPNVRQAAAQPLDPNYRAPLSASAVGGGVAVMEAVGTGHLREKNGTGQVWALGAGPVVIGTSARDCNIVLPPSKDVAGEHVRIWLRDGRYVLHHVGGIARKTYIAGHEADWVTLEPGDELTIGPHKLIFEDPK